jgi:hypothetical protein
MASSKKTSAKNVAHAPVKTATKAPAKAAQKARAKTDEKGPAPALVRYVLAFSRTTLGGGSAEVTETEEAGVVKLACRGVPYATFRIDGNELVVTVRKPNATEDLKVQIARFRKAAAEGWLEWHTPLSRDPRPWLDASVGQFTGQVRYEIRQGGHAG